MIGDHYWATGITLTHFYNGWGASVEFYDSGLAERDAPETGRISSEGTLRTRYQQPTASLAATSLRHDAERLGIEFRPTLAATPLLFLNHSNWLSPTDERGGEETEAGIREAAEALGWTAARRSESDTA